MSTPSTALALFLAVALAPQRLAPPRVVPPSPATQATPPAPAIPTPPPFGELWAVCNGNDEKPCGSLLHFSIATGAIDRVFDIECDNGEGLANDLAITPDGKQMLVAQLLKPGTNQTQTILQTLDLGSPKVLRSVRVDGWLDALEFHPTTGDLWAMHQERETGKMHIVRVDPRSGKLRVVGELPAGLSPRSLAFSADGRELWALSCTNDAAHDELVRLDPKDARVLVRRPWTVKLPAHALELDSSGRLIAIAWGGGLYELERLTGVAHPLSTLSDPYYGGVMGLEFAP